MAKQNVQAQKDKETQEKEEKAMIAEIMAASGLQNTQSRKKYFSLIQMTSVIGAFKSFENHKDAELGGYRIQSQSGSDGSKYKPFNGNNPFTGNILLTRTSFAVKRGEELVGYVGEIDGYNGKKTVLEVLDSSDSSVMMTGTRLEIEQRGLTLKREEVLYVLITEPELVKECQATTPVLEGESLPDDVAVARVKVKGYGFHNPDEPTSFTSYKGTFTGQGMDQLPMAVTLFGGKAKKFPVYGEVYYPAFMKESVIEPSQLSLIMKVTKDVRLLLEGFKQEKEQNRIATTQQQVSSEGTVNEPTEVKSFSDL